MGCTVTLTNEIHGRTSTGVLSALLFDAWSELCELRPRPNYSPISQWIGFVYPVGGEKSTSQATEVTQTEWDIGFTPRTDLGWKLVMLRRRAIAGGMRLLSEEEVLEEVKRRRGELEDDEADLC